MYSTQCLMNLEIFHSDWRNRHSFQPCMSIEWIPCDPVRWFPPCLGVFHHTHALISSVLNTRGEHFRSLEFSLCAALSSPILGPANSSCLCLPRLSTLSSRIRGLPNFPLPMPWLEIIHKAHLIWFPLLRVCSFVAWSPVSWNPCFTYFVHFWLFQTQEHIWDLLLHLGWKQVFSRPVPSYWLSSPCRC